MKAFTFCDSILQKKKKKKKKKIFESFKRILAQVTTHAISKTIIEGFVSFFKINCN
jgi:hypothetical protein